MFGADCWADQKVLIVCKLNLLVLLTRRAQGKKALKRVNIYMLKQDSSKQIFVDDILRQLHLLKLSSQCTEKDCAALRDLVFHIARGSLCHATRKHQDRFDESKHLNQERIEAKHRIRPA